MARQAEPLPSALEWGGIGDRQSVSDSPLHRSWQSMQIGRLPALSSE